MNLLDYFDTTTAMPIPTGLERNASIFGKIALLGVNKKISIGSGTLLLIGVNETRNSNNPGAKNSADSIRKYLYGLSGSVVKQPLIDLGNLKATPSPADTYMALRDVVGFVTKQGATCLVLGGTQELTWSLFLGVSEHKKNINLTLIDQTIDMGVDDGDFSSTGYVNKLLKESPENLLSISIIGYQGYATNSAHIKILENCHHELYRLGAVRNAMSEVEPSLRDSDIVSFDMGCIRQSDSPGAVNPSPNGFYSEEVCQLARYAGLSAKVKVFGIFELNSTADTSGQSSHIAAQTAWHFIEAFNSPAKEVASYSEKNVKRFYVKSPIPNVELIFLRNETKDLWWMELPGTKKTGGKPFVTACSYGDYKSASKGDVPERWLRAWKRMT